LSKINPKYFQVFLGCRIGSPRVERSRGGGLKTPFDLEKWNIFIFVYSTMSPNLFRRIEAIL